MPALKDYDWHQHAWTKNKGGFNPECIPRWIEMAERLQIQPNGAYEVTTDGGIPRVGWRTVVAFEMRTVWPYNHDVPSVLLEGWDGTHWSSLMGIVDIRVRDEK